MQRRPLQPNHTRQGVGQSMIAVQPQFQGSSHTRAPRGRDRRGHTLQARVGGGEGTAGGGWAKHTHSARFGRRWRWCRPLGGWSRHRSWFGQRSPALATSGPQTRCGGPDTAHTARHSKAQFRILVAGDTGKSSAAGLVGTTTRWCRARTHLHARNAQGKDSGAKAGENRGPQPRQQQVPDGSYEIGVHAGLRHLDTSRNGPHRHARVVCARYVARKCVLPERAGSGVRTSACGCAQAGPVGTPDNSQTSGWLLLHTAPVR